jgi:hypothetical protein
MKSPFLGEMTSNKFSASSQANLFSPEAFNASQAGFNRPGTTTGFQNFQQSQRIKPNQLEGRSNFFHFEP